MAVSYKRNSNLRNTPMDVRNLGIYVPALIPNFSQAYEYVITQKYHRRPDLLAYDLYQDSKFWWIFTLFNRNQLVDPINDFVEGITILVPSNDYIAGF